MKPFRFQQFDINQNASVFRVGTDAVLLGALAHVNQAARILEVGTGTGIVSLMLAQRNANALVVAVDINPEAVSIAQENFANSPFSARINCFLQDYKQFETNERYDLIISNPPYFDVNNSEKDVVARQKLELDFLDLIKKSRQLLSPDGRFAVVIPTDSEQNFTALCAANGMSLARVVKICGILGSAPKRSVLEYSLGVKETIIEYLVIEKSPRVYSDEYLSLTKEFHLFNKKPL